MTALQFIGLVVVPMLCTAMGCYVIWGIDFPGPSYEQWKARQLAKQAKSEQAVIDAAHRATIAEMNKVAGQSWRNIGSR